jgi:DNA-binding NarL/FixJ family response regulator
MELFLSSHNDFKIIGTGKDDYAAIKLTIELQPDIVLMDVHLPLHNGTMAAPIIKYRSPATSVIIIADFNNDAHFQQALCSGIAGYLVKEADIEYLAGMIRTVYNGGCFLSPQMAARTFNFISAHINHRLSLSMPEQDALLFSAISDMEILIVSYIGQGFSNKEIADKLHLKQGTVRNYISSILQKTKLRDRTQIAIQAIAQGITVNAPPQSPRAEARQLGLKGSSGNPSGVSRGALQVKGS